MTLTEVALRVGDFGVVIITGIHYELWQHAKIAKHPGPHGYDATVCKAARLESRHFSNSKAYRLLSPHFLPHATPIIRAVFVIQTRGIRSQGSLRDGSPQVGSRGKAPVEGLGDKEAEEFC